MNEDHLSELYEFIAKTGRFSGLVWMGKWLTTYQDDDGLHGMCLELERRGKIARHNEGQRHVTWKPI